VAREQEEVVPEAPAPAEAEQAAPGQVEVGEGVPGVLEEEEEAVPAEEEEEEAPDSGTGAVGGSGSCHADRPRRGGI
jgi:hypothetical protein